MLCQHCFHARIVPEQQPGHNLKSTANMHLPDGKRLDRGVSQFNARAKLLRLHNG